MKRIFLSFLAALGFGVSSNAAAAVPDSQPVKSAAELQPQLTALALRIAKENYRVTLDFSTESVKKVEFILADVHKNYEQTRDESGLHGIALEFAAYIITTIEKNTEMGRWERDHSQFGENSFPFYWKGTTIFPYSWCLKRIYDGEADDVWFKYQALILRHGE